MHGGRSLKKRGVIKLILEQNHVVRPKPGCLRYPESEKNELKRQAMQWAMQQMEDVSLFMGIAGRQRLAPPTEMVGKGQENHRFSIGFPVVIKPYDGRKMIVVENQSEVIQVTKDLKETGYQVQKYLEGYTFLKVRVENGLIERGHPMYIRGAVRSLVKLFVTQGVRNFTLTVATNQETTYIIAGRLN